MLLLDISNARFHVSSVANQPKYAVIIPACDEEACVGAVLAELRAVLDLQECVICVGVNGTSDATATIARAGGAMVAETPLRGYGYGCQAAIDALEREHVSVDAYVFFAADGANDPRDIAPLIAAFRRGAAMVLGCRTRTPGNWTPMNFHYVIANSIFGLLCGLLTGRFFADLGPLRLIERQLFATLQLREWTYGWTIAAQIRAVLVGASISEIPVRERQRIAGVQKVSHVSWWRTLSVGAHVIAAAFRARFAERSDLLADTSPPAVAAPARAALTGTAGAERS